MKRDAQIKLILTFVFFAFGALFFSLGIQKYQVTTTPRAEFDGTACNDNVGDALNSSGSTPFTIICEGNLTRSYSYALFWCPTQKRGDSTFCQDQKIDSDSGAAIPASINKSTDKNCGCVQWDIGVTNTNGEEGIAGGALLCAEASCEQPIPTETPTTPPEQPTNTPTTPPEQPSNTPVPTNTPTTPPDQPTNTPAPSETPTEVPTNTPEPTATNTPVPTDTPTPLPSDTPVPTPTNTPIPTETPLPTATNTIAPTATTPPSPTPTTIIAATNTPTPVEQLAVEGKPPGLTPWLLILAPIGLILLGLLL